MTLKSGQVLNAHTLVWGAGLQASAIADDLGLELEKGNRVVAGPDLSIDGHPEVFAVGDIAWITDTKTKRVLPQLGSVALQAGEQAGANIARRIAGKETEPFVYHDKGTMATIGRGAAVVQFHRRADAQGQGRVARVGHRPPGAPLHGGGPREGDGRVDLGRLHPRATGPDHSADGYVAMERRVE